MLSTTLSILLCLSSALSAPVLSPRKAPFQPVDCSAIGKDNCNAFVNDGVLHGSNDFANHIGILGDNAMKTTNKVASDEGAGSVGEVASSIGDTISEQTSNNQRRGKPSDSLAPVEKAGDSAWPGGEFGGAAGVFQGTGNDVDNKVHAVSPLAGSQEQAANDVGDGVKAETDEAHRQFGTFSNQDGWVFHSHEIDNAVNGNVDKVAGQ